MNELKILSLKMALASTLALIIANTIGLEYAISSAVVAILSIQETKKSTIKIAKKRFIAAIIGILMSAIIYKIIGHNILGFCIFILIFSYIVLKKNIEEGLTVTVVLSTHLFLSDITIMWILNEFAILFVGISVATIINLFMPALEDDFNKAKNNIESIYIDIVSSMSKSLLTQTVNINEQNMFDLATIEVENTKKLAYKIINNRLIEGDYYYLSYADMRANQFNTLLRMRRHFEKFYISYEQTQIISSFTEKVAKNINENNDCVDLIEELNGIRDLMKRMELPKSREEFENRALLLQYINDLEEFLTIKHVFISVKN